MTSRSGVGRDRRSVRSGCWRAGRRSCATRFGRARSAVWNAAGNCSSVVHLSSRECLMTRPIRIARLAFATLPAAAILLPAAAAAQDAEALIRTHGSQPSIPDPSFPAPPTLIYRVSWDVNVGAEKAGDIVPGFRRPASFMVSTDANGVPRKNVHLA